MTMRDRSARGGRSLARVLLLGLLTTVAAGLLSACERGPSGPEVVVYVSADEHFARLVLDRFERESGISVKMVGDTEAKKTTGLVERLRDEADRPQADVFWSSEVFLTIALAEEGVLAPFEPTGIDGWPGRFKDAEGRWYGFSARPRVIVYSTDRVSEADRPVAWTDLGNPRWLDRLVMADPRFGTTGGHLGAMKAYWDAWGSTDYYEAFLLKLADNNVRMLASGNAGVVDAVVRGEADVGMTDSDDVWAAIDAGHPVDMVMPDHDLDDTRIGVGTLLIPNTVGVVAGGPNPDSALVLASFLLAEATERQLAESTSRNVPIRPSLANAYPDLTVPNPLRIDLARAAAEREAAVAKAIELLTPDETEEEGDLAEVPD